MSSLIIDPIRIFEIKGVVCPMYWAQGAYSPGDNQLLVSAVPGQRIRVFQWYATSSNAAIGLLEFKDGSGGSNLMPAFGLPLRSAGGMIGFPYIEPGLFETSTGVALYVDVITDSVTVFINYITYTP